jgi:hypothetical protein
VFPTGGAELVAYFRSYQRLVNDGPELDASIART